MQSREYLIPPLRSRSLGAGGGVLDIGWALKWGMILIGGAVLVATPFVVHAYVTKKPGTIWAEE